MSATPPFGPAYDQPPDDGRRTGPNQWQPQPGRPRAAQGGSGQAPNGHTPPEGHRPQAGRPAAGQGPPPSAGGRPQAGGPQAGRPVPAQYPPPQAGGPPPSPPRPGGRQYRPAAPQQPGPPAPPDPDRAPEPFEEAAFSDDATAWGGGEGTQAIGKLGYVPKETRKRSDFQKVRSRARKSSPIPKIIAAVVALGLVGLAGWWWLNRDDGPAEEEAVESGLTYARSEEPCGLADTAALDGLVDGVEPEPVGETRDRQRGWEQSCVLTYGEADSASALLEFDGTVFESDAKAGVNYELGAGEVAEMADPWTVIEPAPAIGDQAAAVSRVVEEGTSNYQLHLQDDNIYLVVRLSVVDSGLDQQGMTDLAMELATSYLDSWQDAS
ncbi:hypothetical protein [Glycomyces halotolerans]